MDTTQEQSDRGDAKGKVWRKGKELPCPPSKPFSTNTHASTTQKLSKLLPCGYLWRLIP